MISEVIIDGNIIKANLEAFHKTEDWLMKKLKDMQFDNYNDIILATLNSQDEINVYLHSEN